MRLNGRACTGTWLFALGLCLTHAAGAATAIKINSARVDQSTANLLIEGVNFPTDGTLEVAIGDTFLDGCAITATSASCSIESTPAAAGGSWSVSLSAGNSPHNNAAIDVYVPSGQVASCYPGDYVSCYPSDRAELGVGECAAGVRTCQGDGTYSACTGAVTPLAEYPDHCGDGLDNDCDGRVDNGCDVLIENPTIFTHSGTFSLPSGATNVEIAVWGPGSAGGDISGGRSGHGGGSGGVSVIESLAVEEGDQFTVNMSGSRSAVSRNGVEITFATAGSLPAGGEGSLGNGEDGGLGQLCEVSQTSSVCTESGGAGGRPRPYLGRSAGAGGKGEDIRRVLSCRTYCAERDWLNNCVRYEQECWVNTYSDGPAGPGSPGLVVVGWQMSP